MIGTLQDQYRILGSLGAGGMGEVFRALDTQLNREVAIKMLPKELASDPDRVRRFELESKTLAALNHPNILTIHDAGVQNGTPYLVSELLEGQTLREELARGALPLRKATDYARQIAQGLAAAHDKGIIHRDLKPENIFITKDRRVKILDFGLAKLQQSFQSQFSNVKSVPNPDAPTVVQSTEDGRILGTPAYMSPEQVRGEPADHRSDIFAFGSVLYEMLTGSRAFKRDTPVQSMNSVLSEEPYEADSGMNNFPLLGRVVRRCLAKQPDDRFQSAKDLGFAIETLGANPSFLPSGPPQQARPGRAIVSAMLAMVPVVVGVVLWHLATRKNVLSSSQAQKPTGVLRKFELTLPERRSVAGEDRELHLALAPDGKKFAYANAEGLWLRWLDRIAPPILLVQGSTISDPFWSPQSTDIGFFDGRKIFRTSLDGGRPLLIAPTPEEPRSGIAGGAWLSTGRILFTTGMSALYEVPAEGGKVSTALNLDEGDLDFHFCSALPGGRGVLFVVHRDTSGPDTIALWTPQGQRKTLLCLPADRVFNPVFSSTGHVLFQRFDAAQGLWAFPFSLATLERTNEPFRVSEIGNQASVADDGTLLFSLESIEDFTPRQLAWVDRSGNILGTVGPPLPGLSSPRISPDGRRVVAAAGESAANLTLRFIDVASGQETSFSRGQEREDMPMWLPDGTSVIFTRFAEGGAQVLAKAADGTDREELLFQGAGNDLSRTGMNFLLSERSPGGKVTSGYVPLASKDRTMIPLPRALRRFYRMRLSPDNRLLAYHSEEGGRWDVWVVDFPGFTNKVCVSRGDAEEPEWNPNGTELFFLANKLHTMMSARLKPDTRQWEDPVKLFDLPAPIWRNNPWRTLLYDVTADGERFLMMQSVPVNSPTNQPTKPNVRLVENWFEEFREKDSVKAAPTPQR